MLLIQIATGVVYFMSIALLQEYFDTSYIDSVFFVKIGIITMITWAPLHLIYWISETCDPSEHKKIILDDCLLYTSPSPRDRQKSRMPSSA